MSEESACVMNEGKEMRHSIKLLRFHNALLCTMLTTTNNSTGSQKHLIFPLFSVLCLWIKFTFLFGCVPSVLKKKKKRVGGTEEAQIWLKDEEKGELRV